MQEPSRRSRTRRSDPHTVRLEQELEEMRQQRELDLQRIASLEAQQQRFASLEAQMLQFMTKYGHGSNAVTTAAAAAARMGDVLAVQVYVLDCFGCCMMFWM